MKRVDFGALFFLGTRVQGFLLRICDYIFVTRPMILIPAWSFFLLGVGIGERFGVGHRDAFYGIAGGKVLVYAVLTLTFVLISAYLANTLIDEDTDDINDKGHFLTKGVFTHRTLIMMTLVFFFLAAYCYRLTNWSQRWPLAMSLVLALTYSLPPLRFSARPVLDLVANAVGYGGIAVVTGALCFRIEMSLAWWLATPYMIMVGATFMHTTILDEEGDRATGKFTSTVWLGMRASSVIAAVLGVSAAAIAAWQGYRGETDYVPVWVTGAGAVLYLGAAIRQAGAPRPDGYRAVSAVVVQATTAVVTIAAAVIEPRYLAVLIPLILLARYYYRVRFGILYPGPAS